MRYRVIKNGLPHFNQLKDFKLTTSDVVFLTTIAGGFCFFITDSGCIEHAIWILFFLLIFLFKKTPDKILFLSPVILACVVFFSLYIFINVDEKNFDLATQAITRIFKFLVLAYAVMISTHSTLWKKYSFTIFVFLSALWVLINVSYYFLSQGGNPATGVYSNPHYLATNSILILPFLGVSWKKKSYSLQAKIFLIALCIIGFFLFFKTNSVAAFSGLVVSFFFVFLCLSRRKKSAFIFLATLLISGFYFIYFAQRLIFENSDSLIFEKITQDERIEIWADTWKAYQNMSLKQKFFGAGIGGFREIFPLYSSSDHSHFIFPHAFVIEIAFDYGLPGLILFVVLIFNFFSIFKNTLGSSTAQKNLGFLLYIYLGAVIAWILTANFVYPLLSKNTLYPFAFILGWLSTKNSLSKTDEGTEHGR